MLSEVEACFSALWVGVQGGDSAKDVLADATVILKLESLIRNLESVKFYNCGSPLLERPLFFYSKLAFRIWIWERSVNEFFL